MSKEDISKRIQGEEDYIRAPKFQNSLAKFVSKNDEGVDNATIARVLMINKEKVEEIYNESVEMLREQMSKDDEDL